MYVIYSELFGFYQQKKLPDLTKMNNDFYIQSLSGRWHKPRPLVDTRQTKNIQTNWVIVPVEELPKELKIQALLLNIPL